ncbi:MAG: RluA family pseudouridine synthase [Verrucomicrobiota bacterium]
MKPSAPVILHEDNHLLVVVKPPGVPTQGDASGDDALNERLKDYLRTTHNKPGDAFLGIVHRLDRPVGGVMVFAKTSKAAGRLSEQIRTRTIRKGYLAVVRGAPPSGEHTLVHHLSKDKRRNVVTVVSPDASGAKKAELTYVRQATTGAFSLVEINLRTGRPHQIRVQMATVGHALLGDSKYGRPSDRVGSGPALWAYSLSFTHPTLRTPLTFTAFPPVTTAPWRPFAKAIRQCGESIRKTP